MISHEAELAARYRAHARQLRDIAESDMLEETKQMLIRIAAGYEKLAKTMEELDKAHARRPAGKDAGN